VRVQRIFTLMCLFLAVYLALTFKIAYYQLFKGPELARQAVSSHSREIGLKEYARGEIFDRNFLPLTSTSSSMAAYCLVNKSKDENHKNREEMYELAGFLADVFAKRFQSEEEYQELMDQSDFRSSITKQDAIRNGIYKKMQTAARNGQSIMRIAVDLSSEEIARLNSAQRPGIVVAPVIKRYREDGFCAHLIGYVGTGNDSSGKTGLEKRFNKLLSGNEFSHELVSVLDARGDIIQGLMFKIRESQESDRGSLVLTIDKRIQEIVENVMTQKMKKGAVVVMDISSKEILAMASRPVFNPYDLQSVLKDTEGTLRNRALNRYHPGSLFKLLVAVAALEEGTVNPNDRFICNGKYTFSNDLSISCWKEEGHGAINFAQALAYSCNPSFIEVGLKLGRFKLMEYAEKMHVSDETIQGYDNYNAGSYIVINPGNPALANACLGQQGVMLTPVQVASLIATIADKGQWGPPALVRYTIDKNGNKQIISNGEKEQVISVKTANLMRELMAGVVTSGTGKAAALPDVQVAGKTATSQTGNINDDNEEILNSWFGGFFPADNPRWAIVVMVEEGTSGSADAAPVFKDIASAIMDLNSIN